MKKKLKTKAVTQTKTQETFIEQELWLPIQWPMATDRLVLKVYDEDKVSDEIVGSMYFSLKKIVNEMGP
jgi:Ca2+-dependent lipid-binding protein